MRRKIIQLQEQMFRRTQVRPCSWIGRATRSGLCLVVLLVSATGVAARDGTVQTRDGKTFNGNVRVDRGRLVIANLDAELFITIPASNLLHADFERPALTSPVPSPELEDPPESGALPRPWTLTGVGPADGGVRYLPAPGIFRFSSGGLGLGGNSDSVTFVSKPAAGNSEIIARIIRVPAVSAHTKAGVMMRSSEAHDAAYAFVGVGAGLNGGFQWRTQNGGPTSIKVRMDLTVPSWVRLRREGDNILAYHSRNGRRWHLLDKVYLPLPPQMLVGLAVAGAVPATPPRGATRLQEADFDYVREGRSLPLTSFVPRVQLRSGSILGAGQAVSPTGDEFRFEGIDYKPPVASTHIANVQFQWLPTAQAARINLGRPGAVVSSGDFIEGEFRGWTEDEVRLSSVLFGVRRYDINSQLLAVILHAPAPPRVPYEIETWDGSFWRVESYILAENAVVVQEPLLGQVRIPSYQLRSLRTLSW